MGSMKAIARTVRYTEDEVHELREYAELTGEQEAVVLARASIWGLREERFECGLMAYLGGASSVELPASPAWTATPSSSGLPSAARSAATPSPRPCCRTWPASPTSWATSDWRRQSPGSAHVLARTTPGQIGIDEVR